MDLENRIARLELRREQLGIHLQDLPRNGRGSDAGALRTLRHAPGVGGVEDRASKAQSAARIGRSLVAAAALAVWSMRQ